LRFTKEVEYTQRAHVRAPQTCPAVVDAYPAANTGSLGRDVLVLEWLEGPSLASLGVEEVRSMARSETPAPGTHLSLIDKLRAFAPLLDDLQAVHDEGLVHRDVTPHNIKWVGRRLRLFDFGIAATSGDMSDDFQSGMFTGSLHYAPPEQVRTRNDQDYRVDIFGAGVTLFAWLTASQQAPWDPVQPAEAREPAPRRGDDELDWDQLLKDIERGQQPTAKSTEAPAATPEAPTTPFSYITVEPYQLFAEESLGDLPAHIQADVRRLPEQARRRLVALVGRMMALDREARVQTAREAADELRAIIRAIVAGWPEIEVDTLTEVPAESTRVEQQGRTLYVAPEAQRAMDPLDTFVAAQPHAAEICGYGLTQPIDEQTSVVVDFVSPHPDRIYIVGARDPEPAAEQLLNAVAASHRLALEFSDGHLALRSDDAAYSFRWDNDPADVWSAIRRIVSQ